MTIIIHVASSFNKDFDNFFNRIKQMMLNFHGYQILNKYLRLLNVR